MRFLSRRRVLELSRSLALSTLAGAYAFPAKAEKVDKALAKYQPRPKGIQRCEICLQFIPPSNCKLVEGEISPKGWCQFFAARENAQ